MAAALSGLAVALAVGVAVASFLPPVPGPQSAALAVDGLTAAERAVLPKLDADSRRLARALGPNETVRATYSVGTSDRATQVSNRARAMGLDPRTSDEDRPTVLVTGARSTILAIASMVAVSRVGLEEDTRADRAVAAPLSQPMAVPQPGAPYAGVGLPLDRFDLTGLGDHRATMLASLPELVVTIDGTAYDQLELDARCDSESCEIQLIGRGAGSTSSGDRRAVRGVPAGGWIGVLDPGDPPSLASVPHQLVREAERIARADPATAAAIRTTDTIGDPRWDPASPGVITLSYTSNCGCCGGVENDLAGQLADADPDPCAAGLSVVVDVGAGRVVAIRPS